MLSDLSVYDLEGFISEGEMLMLTISKPYHLTMSMFICFMLFGVVLPEVFAVTSSGLESDSTTFVATSSTVSSSYFLTSAYGVPDCDTSAWLTVVDTACSGPLTIDIQFYDSINNVYEDAIQVIFLGDCSGYDYTLQEVVDYINLKTQNLGNDAYGNSKNYAMSSIVFDPSTLSYRLKLEPRLLNSNSVIMTGRTDVTTSTMGGFCYATSCTIDLLISDMIPSAPSIVVPDHYPTIQTAINASADGYQITVRPGHYTENIDFGGKNIILKSIDPDDRNIVETTVIDGVGSGSVVTFTGAEGSSYKLQGFTITGGSHTRGAGITGNRTSAGIYNCIIAGNSATNGGGLADCDGDIHKCVITGNSASANGGGIVNCAGNISNCLLYNNTSSLGGGLDNCNGTITNCTIADNTASVNGGGLSYCNAVIMNCIVWGNSANDIYECSLPEYTCYPEADGMGNIPFAPMFADSQSGDYHLKSEGFSWNQDQQQWQCDESTSPCIDAGNPGMPLADEPIALDLDPMNRLSRNVRINMGAYGGTSQASIPPLDWVLLTDLTNDGQVDISDANVLLSNWLGSEQDSPGDVNRDGFVNLQDIGLLSAEWSEVVSR